MGEIEQTRAMTGLRAPSQKPGGGTSGDQLSGGNVGEGFRLGAGFITGT